MSQSILYTGFRLAFVDLHHCQDGPMISSMDSTRPSVRRSRWRLWVSLGVFVLLAIAAIPAWRYYWHTEYQRHLRTISRNPRDSYHEPPPWSVLA